MEYTTSDNDYCSYLEHGHVVWLTLLGLVQEKSQSNIPLQSTINHFRFSVNLWPIYAQLAFPFSFLPTNLVVFWEYRLNKVVELSAAADRNPFAMVQDPRKNGIPERESRMLLDSKRSERQNKCFFRFCGGINCAVVLSFHPVAALVRYEMLLVAWTQKSNDHNTLSTVYIDWLIRYWLIRCILSQ